MTATSPDPRPTGPVIAIDGPAGSGKSTVSRALAERLGLDRLDTGAMYRAVAWAALSRGIELADLESVARLARHLEISVGEQVTAGGTDITAAIRGPEVSAAVSTVAANPEVRAALVQHQRRWVAQRGGGVVEGRDIGSVVFPEADLKVFLTATPEERARRRPEEGARAVARRDRLDSTRDVSPLGVADGARVVDTTDRTVEDIVEELLTCL
jgi:cytidylate kinase